MTKNPKVPDISPPTQEGYIWSAEYVELRGICATKVAPRAAILDDPAHRSLIWFLQGRSLQPGGLKQIAHEVLERFGDRIGTSAMHEHGMKPGKIYNAPQVREIRKEFPARCQEDFILRDEEWNCLYHHFETVDEHSGEYRLSQIDEAKKHPVSYPVEAFLKAFGDQTGCLVNFLIDLCINPRLRFRPKKNSDTRDYEQRLQDAYPNQEIKTYWAELWWFQDIIGALMEYKRQSERAARETFIETGISRKIWKALDFALSTRSMVLIVGEPGRGKSEAAKPWAQSHLGECRFIDLRGITGKTSIFREICKALGIAICYSRTADGMRARIEDVLERSGLFLILDEAHFAFSQNKKVYSRPEIIDWIDTSLVNHRIAVALIATPQFLTGLSRAAQQVEWNYHQFRRRVKYIKLAAKNTEQDIRTVATKVLPGAGVAAVTEVLSYVLLTKRDLSAVGEVVREVKDIQGTDTLTKVTYDQVMQAIDGELKPIETNFVADMRAAGDKCNRGRRRAIRPAPADLETSDPDAEQNGARDLDGEHRSLEVSRLPMNLTTV